MTAKLPHSSLMDVADTLPMFVFEGPTQFQLNFLLLNYQGLTDLHAGTLPDSFNKLAQLAILRLDSNDLTGKFWQPSAVLAISLCVLQR